MISKQFNNGNYNEWDTLVSRTMPEINKGIKENIVPSLDKILISMLGETSEIIKENISVEQKIENNRVSSIICTLEYVISDFKVPEAPEKAINEDTESIINAVNSPNLTDVKIDTNEGKLTATLSYIL